MSNNRKERTPLERIFGRVRKFGRSSQPSSASGPEAPRGRDAAPIEHQAIQPMEDIHGVVRNEQDAPNEVPNIPDNPLLIQIENLSQNLNELIARVSHLSSNNVDREQIANLRADILNREISSNESLERFSSIVNAISESTSIYTDELAELNNSFRQLSARMEALSIPDEQRPHIQSITEGLNNISARILQLNNDQGIMNSDMSRLRTDIERIQANSDLFRDEIEQNGLHFQNALSALAAGLTAVLENRVMPSIHALRNTFEIELLGIQSNLDEILQHAVGRDDIDDLRRIIEDNAAQNQQKLQEIIQAITALQAQRALPQPQNQPQKMPLPNEAAPVDRFGIFNQKNNQRHDAYVWEESNGNHRLRDDGIVVKHNRPLSKKESQDFIDHNMLQNFLGNQSLNLI